MKERYLKIWLSLQRRNISKGTEVQKMASEERGFRGRLFLNLGLNSGPHTCLAGALPLKPPILF
jgi:hypothetical protein